MMGITAISKITARVLPRPKLRKRNISEYMRLAITSVLSWPLVITKTMSKTFKMPIAMVVATVDPLGRRTTTTYDPLSRPTVVLDAKEGRATNIYDKLNRRVATIDAGGDRTSFVYDKAHRVIATIDALSKRWTSVYDRARQRTVAIKAGIAKITFRGQFNWIVMGL